MKPIIIILLSTCIISCKKKAVHKKYPQFIGDWSHHDNNDEHWFIDITDTSSGTITVYDSDYDNMNLFGVTPHRWRYNETKKELTYHRLVPDRFHVDQFPQKAETLIINQHDTIEPNRTYMIIDGNYFLKSE